MSETTKAERDEEFFISAIRAGDLWSFVRESNRIEGIGRNPTNAEIEAHRTFLALKEVTVEALCAFVSVVQPGAVLRDRKGLDVRVGRHVPMRGGPLVEAALGGLLDNLDTYSPYYAHVTYETIHPFTDGNGRSGRVLWLWMMKGDASLGFLHRFYYQALEAAQ